VLANVLKHCSISYHFLLRLIVLPLPLFLLAGKSRYTKVAAVDVRTTLNAVIRFQRTIIFQ